MHRRSIIHMCVFLTIAALCSLKLHGAEEFTPAIQKSIPRGIKWLVQSQNKDGSWGMDSRSPADVACTAMAGLSILSGGFTERDGGDPGCVNALKKSVDYLLSKAKKMRARGNIAEGESSQIQTYIGQHVHTFLAALFLTQVYGMRSPEFSHETYEEMREAIQKLTDSIAMTQETDGSWHKDTYSSLQATCMAWMALRSASSSGIEIKGATIERTLKFIRRQYNPQSKQYDAGRNSGNSIYASSSAVRIMYGMGLRDQKESRNAMDTMIASLCKGPWGQHFMTATGEDYPAAVFITHSLVQEGGENWKTWYGYVSNKLTKIQNADGSWTTTSCLVGRTFATACALLCLQTPERLLPIQDL